MSTTEELKQVVQKTGNHSFILPFFVENKMITTTLFFISATVRFAVSRKMDDCLLNSKKKTLT